MSSEILGPGVGYVDLLAHVTEEKLQNDAATGKSFQKTPIRPSAAGKCTRELFYELMEFHGRAKYPKEVLTPEVHRIFQLGHSVEYHVLKQFELLASVFEIRYKQQVLSFEFLKAVKDDKLSQWLEGSLDVVFWSEKWKCVADVKSKKDKFSNFFKTDWDWTSSKLGDLTTVKKISDSAFWVDDLPSFLEELKDPFFAGNFLQLNLYANSQFLKERGVDHGAVLQYNKNDSRLREIRFRPSTALYEKTLNKFKTALVGVDAATVPARDYALGSVKCAFCSYKAECWEGMDAKQEFFNTLPAKDWPKRTSELGALGETLDSFLEDYEEFQSMEGDAKTTEERIVKAMVDANIRKIQGKSGRVYEAKKLKDGIVLRRSKA